MKMSNGQDFRNAYKGKPIFVAGTGSSLRFVNSSLAEKHIVIAVNGALVKFPQARYFFASDSFIILTNYWAMLKDLDCKITIAVDTKDYGFFSNLKHVYSNPKAGISEDRIIYFPRSNNWKMGLDRESLAFGVCSVHFAVHFAQILGGNPIVLLGCDCNMAEEKVHFYDYEDQPNGYFLEKFRKHVVHGEVIPCKGMKDECKRRFKGVLVTWRKLKEINPNVNIINASGGCLDAFPRENLDKLLGRFSK